MNPDSNRKNTQIKALKKNFQHFYFSLRIQQLLFIWLNNDQFEIKNVLVRLDDYERSGKNYFRAIKQINKTKN